MSVENLKEFLRLADENETVSQKAAEIGYRNYAGLIAYGKELKLEFNENDFEELRKKALKENQALSDAELGDVSGGVPGWWDYDD